LKFLAGKKRSHFFRTSLFWRQNFQNSNVRVYTQKIFFFKNQRGVAVFTDGRQEKKSRASNPKFQPRDFFIFFFRDKKNPREEKKYSITFFFSKKKNIFFLSFLIF